MNLDQLTLLLKENSSFIISTHKHCDGDGLGSGIALYHGLKKLGKKVQFLTLEKPHSKYDFLNTKKYTQVFNNDFKFPTENTILLIIDTNDPSLTEPLYSAFKQKHSKVCFIDHHPISHKKIEDLFFINPEASSVAEIIHAIHNQLNIPLDENISTALFTSIVFDTNQFRNIKNSPVSFSLSSQFIPYIKDVNLIYDNLFKNLTVEKMNFLSKVKNIEYYSNNTIAFLYLEEEEIERCKTDASQVFDIMDTVQNIKTIQSTVLIIKNKDNSFKLSLRSRKKDLLPLAKIFDGGGHTHSAGAYIKDQSLEDIKKKAIEYLKR